MTGATHTVIDVFVDDGLSQRPSSRKFVDDGVVLQPSSTEYRYKYVDDGFVGDKVTTACNLGARAEKLNGPA